MILLINHDDMMTKSFRALFKKTDEGCSFNVTFNQYKRIKHYLLTCSIDKPELWENPLFMALCMDEWMADEIEIQSSNYSSEVTTFYTSTRLAKQAQSMTVTGEIKLFESGTNNIVIGESHGTTAPLTLLNANIKELVRVKAAVLIEGLSTAEIEEINYCNNTQACSLLMYMLIPIEKSMRNEAIGLEKRKLISSLIKSGIKIIPGDNEHSINLGPDIERLRLFNYSAIQNALSAGHEGPILFLVGKAHAVDTDGCPGIVSLIGARLIDLTQTIPLVSEPISAGEEQFRSLLLRKSLRSSIDVSTLEQGADKQLAGRSEHLSGFIKDPEKQEHQRFFAHPLPEKPHNKDGTVDFKEIIYRLDK